MSVERDRQDPTADYEGVVAGDAPAGEVPGAVHVDGIFTRSSDKVRAAATNFLDRNPRGAQVLETARARGANVVAEMKRGTRLIVDRDPKTLRRAAEVTAGVLAAGVIIYEVAKRKGGGSEGKKS